MSVRINSNNFNGKSVEITFNPFTGGTIDLGTQTIPYDYISSNYEGNYSIYIPEYDKTCSLVIGSPPTPTPSTTPTLTPTPTLTSTPTPTLTSTSTPTPTLTSTPTPTITTPSIDPDAAAYLADVVASGGTTNATIDAAVDTLFTSLKSAGLYTKIYAMYPYVGGTASSHAIEAKLNKSFDITWFGGMTHGVSGSTGNGSNGYGDTGFNPYVEIGSTAGISSHSSIYVGTDTNGNFSEFGARDGSHTWIMAASYSDTYYGWEYTAGGLSEVSFSTPDSRGSYIQTRNAINNLVVYRNNTLGSTSTLTENNRPPNNNIDVFYDGNAYTDRRIQFTTIGDGLTVSEIGTLDGIINTFQTSLGRNVY